MNKSAGIVVAELCKAVCLGGFKVFLCIVSKNSTLERIEEANTEIMCISFGYLRICAGNADYGNSAVLENVACGDRNA